MRKGLVWTLVVLLVLGVGGYFGDSFLRAYAQDRIAETVDQHLSDGRSTIRLGGTPFILALFTRSVPNAHVEIPAMPQEVSGHPVHLTDVVADTGEIRLTGDGASIASLTGSAVLSYADLSTIAGLPITHAEGGRLQLRYETDVFGSRISLAVSALPDVDVDKQVIRLTDPKFNVNGNPIDIGVTQDQLDALVKPIPVKLDHGLRLTGLTPGGRGVAIGVDGTNIRVPLP
ncbi:MAG TPA: DUF2993 domain-containing protein [Propionicimonas sp.]|jgi:hypothetical protein